MIFNGKDLIAYCGGGISINKEIPPFSVGRSITSIGGAGGHIIGNVTREPKTYTARINLHGRSMHEAWELKLKVAEWAYTEALADLIPTHDPSRKYRAICQSISDPEFKWGACTVDVVFYIPDPFMLAVEPRTFGGAESSVSWRTNGTMDPLIKVTFTASETLNYPQIKLNGNTILGVVGEVGVGVICVADFDAKTLMLNGGFALTKINFTNTNWHPAFQENNTITVNNAVVSCEVVDRWL